MRTPPSQGAAPRQLRAESHLSHICRRARRPDLPPIEVHILADDVVVEHEVPAIELLRGRACGPSCIGDLMRAARRP
jgi:hypothetical protein